MFKRLGVHSDEMALALTLWLCSLPLVAMLIIPFLGLRVAGLGALGLLIGAMVICWGACGWKHVTVEERKESRNDYDQH